MSCLGTAKNPFGSLHANPQAVAWWVVPLLLMKKVVFGCTDEATENQPPLLFQLDDLLPGHPVQPLVELPHTEVDQLLGGANGSDKADTSLPVGC